MKSTKLLSTALLSLSLISCAGFSRPVPPSSSGFLDGDYSQLQPVQTNNDNVSLYRYIDPSFVRSNYHGVIINPVTIYNPTTNQNDSTLIRIKNSLNSYILNIASKQLNVTNKPGSGIAVVDIAITGADVVGDGFKPRNLIPVSAVIKAATMVTGTDNKQAVILIEAKLTDSQTKQILGQSVTKISSDKFRDVDATSEQFQNNVNTWVMQAVSSAVGSR